MSAANSRMDIGGVGSYLGQTGPSTSPVISLINQMQKQQQLPTTQPAPQPIPQPVSGAPFLGDVLREDRKSHGAFVCS